MARRDLFQDDQGHMQAETQQSSFSWELTVYFVEFTETFKYLGSIIHHSLTSHLDVVNRINAATGAMCRLKKTLQRLDIDIEIRGKIYITLVMNILLYGSECWTMNSKLIQRLRVFHARNLRTICRVNLLMTRHKHISTADLQEKLAIKSMKYYYYTRTLRWAGHIARMPTSRVPRKFITGWVNHKRSTAAGRYWGNSLCKALAAAELPAKFGEWSILAQDKTNWRKAVKSARYEDEDQPAENETLGCCAQIP